MPRLSDRRALLTSAAASAAFAAPVDPDWQEKEVRVIFAEARLIRDEA